MNAGSSGATGAIAVERRTDCAEFGRGQLRAGRVPDDGAQRRRPLDRGKPLETNGIRGEDDGTAVAQAVAHRLPGEHRRDRHADRPDAEARRDAMRAHGRTGAGRSRPGPRRRRRPPQTARRCAPRSVAISANVTAVARPRWCSITATACGRARACWSQANAAIFAAERIVPLSGRSEGGAGEQRGHGRQCEHRGGVGGIDRSPSTIGTQRPSNRARICAAVASMPACAANRLAAVPSARIGRTSAFHCS